ncbi:Leukocyte immunoglobulin-like receptor subfamily A member 1 [Myotis brandtii]|nr:Leukocyte immunoglobulin-like receptor subfamily A member 1 [Myotis brandtii]
MADSTTTLTFIVLLGLEFIPSPLIWADPGHFITNGSSVTIWCEEYLRASAHSLYKDGGSDPLEIRIPQYSSNKAGFLIEAMTPSHTGLYQCAYYTTEDKLSQRSQPRSDSFPEFIPSPLIWADPGRFITNGSSVTIWCEEYLQASAHSLYKDRGSDPLEIRIPQDSSNKAGFLIEAMTPSHTGLYQCAYYTTEDKLSQRSHPLLLVVTGMYPAPSLSAQPSPVVASGGNVSLSCSSQFTSGPFHLLMEGKCDPPRHMEAELRIHNGRSQAQAIFSLDPVITSHGGTYRCYGSSSSNPNVWSQPSAPLHIEVTDTNSSVSSSVSRMMPSSLAFSAGDTAHVFLLAGGTRLEARTTWAVLAPMCPLPSTWHLQTHLHELRTRANTTQLPNASKGSHMQRRDFTAHRSPDAEFSLSSKGLRVS